MAPYTFILRKDDEEWKAERVASEEGDLGDLPTEGSTYKMQRALYRIALNASSGGSVATTFSTISPTVAIYQVCVGGAAAFGGGSGGGGGGGGGGSGGAAAAAEEEKPAEEEKKEEEEEEDDDMGFSLFD